jgi:hypothetical protein
MHLNVFLYSVTNAFSTGIEPLTASARKSVVIAEREITEPRIVKVHRPALGAEYARINGIYHHQRRNELINKESSLVYWYENTNNAIHTI